MSRSGSDVRKSRATFAALLAAAALPAQQAPPPAPSDPPAASSGPADPFREAHARRVARETAALEAELAAVTAFGHDDEFAAALDAISGAIRGAGWWKTDDGMLPPSSIDHWLVWNRPQHGRKLPTAIDVEVEGHPYAAIVDLARQLDAHGIEFLFVCFPTRAQCYPEVVVPGLDTNPDPASGRPPFRGIVEANTRFLLELSKAGVEVVNLAPVFVDHRIDEADPKRRLLYLQSNVHWAPRGAELAAKTVAGRVAEQPWFKPGAYKEGRSFDITRREISFHGGGSAQAPDAPPEPLAMNRVKMRGPPLQRDAARHAPIVLLGDSFAWFHQDLQSSFWDHLFRYTGYAIDLIAPAGGTEFSCRDALRRRGDGLRDKKLVIWLVQEAALLPSDEFVPIDLFPK